MLKCKQKKPNKKKPRAIFKVATLLMRERLIDLTEEKTKFIAVHYHQIEKTHLF